MTIPKGVINVDLRDDSQPGWVEVPVLCEVEVLMVAFAKSTCRLRVKALESKAGYKEGEAYKNLDTYLTPDIMGVILNSAGLIDDD